MTISRKDHLPCLDGLRAIAVLLVLWGHLPLLLGRVELAAKTAFAPAYLGVDIFFVLSGFLITRILCFDLDHGGTIGQFYARRTLRIFPIYYLTLLIVWLLGPDLHYTLYAFYVQNIAFSFRASGSDGPPLSHTWSLAVEEHFYLFWPLIVLLVSRRWMRGVTIALIVVCCSAMWLHAFSGRHATSPIFYFTPYRIPALLAGALLALYESPLRDQPRRVIRVAVTCLIVGALVAGSARLQKPAIGDAVYHAARNVGMTLISVAILSAILAVEFIGKATVRPLATTPLVFIGRISYGIYLYHFPIYYALGLTTEKTNDFAPLWIRSAIGLFATLIAATASFYLIEKPILRYKERFTVRARAAETGTAKAT